MRPKGYSPRLRDHGFIKEVKLFIKGMNIGASVKDNYDEILSTFKDSFTIAPDAQEPLNGAAKIAFGMSGDELQILYYVVDLIPYYEIYRYGSYDSPEPPEEINLGIYTSILDAMIIIGQEIVRLRASAVVLSNEQFEDSYFEMDAVGYTQGWKKIIKQHGD